MRPPFAAAPVEGRTARTWLGLGVAGAALALCCGVGVVAVGGLVVTGVQAVNEQARDAVADYLDAVREREWQDAYDQLCRRDQQQESLEQFTDRVADLPQIESYDPGDVEYSAAGDIRVPVDLEYASGEREHVVVPLEQDQTGTLRVCGFDR